MLVTPDAGARPAGHGRARALRRYPGRLARPPARADPAGRCSCGCCSRSRAGARGRDGLAALLSHPMMRAGRSRRAHLGRARAYELAELRGRWRCPAPGGCRPAGPRRTRREGAPTWRPRRPGARADRGRPRAARRCADGRAAPRGAETVAAHRAAAEALAGRRHRGGARPVVRARTGRRRPAGAEGRSRPAMGTRMAGADGDLSRAAADPALRARRSAPTRPRRIRASPSSARARRACRRRIS